MRLKKSKSKIKLWPSYKQFIDWTIPSKVGFISFILAICGIIFTVSIFIYQEHTAKQKEKQVRSQSEKPQRIGSNSFAKIHSNMFLPSADNCPNKSEKCLIPEILTTAKTKKLLNNKQYIRKIIYHRKGIEFLILEKNNNSKIIIIPDLLKYNKKPQPLEPFETQYLNRIEYIRFAQDAQPGILIIGLSGARGKGLDIALFSQTKHGYRNLFKDINDQISNEYSIFEDIDADGVDDFVTVTYQCELKMYSLFASHGIPAYADTKKNTNEILHNLDQSILGSELASAYRKIKKLNCPKITDDGGHFWEEVREIIFKHRQNIAYLAQISNNQEDLKSKIIFIDETLPTLLIR